MSFLARLSLFCLLAVGATPQARGQMTPTETTAALQRQLDEFGAVTLPGGVTSIDAPLVLRHATGYRITGFGAGPQTRPKALSTLRYEGPPGEPMIRCHASHVSIDGLGFECGEASAALHFIKEGRGTYSPGKVDLGTIYVEGAKTAAIICGDETEPLGWHCDELHVGMIYARKCARVLLVNNAQSMKHSFAGAHIYLTPIGFEYRGGGGLSVASATVLHECDLLLLDPQPKAIGSSNASYSLREVKFDQQALPGSRLVNMLGSAGALIRFDGVRVPSRGMICLARLIGPTVLTIAGMTGADPNGAELEANIRGESPLVYVRESSLPRDFVPIDRVRIRDCWSYPALPIP